MSKIEYTDKAIAAVSIASDIPVDQLYIVWFAKVLKNWKALVSTGARSENDYFEVTHDGEWGQTYVDTYDKKSNQTIDNADLEDFFEAQD